jgi:hypothetical protein
MAPVIQVARVSLFVPAAARLDVAQVKFAAPTPPSPGSVGVLQVSQVKFAAPTPPVPAVLQVAQVKFKAPLAVGEAPYSGVKVARSGNLHNVSLQIAADGEL